MCGLYIFNQAQGSVEQHSSTTGADIWRTVVHCRRPKVLFMTPTFFCFYDCDWQWRRSCPPFWQWGSKCARTPH